MPIVRSLSLLSLLVFELCLHATFATLTLLCRREPAAFGCFKSTANPWLLAIARISGNATAAVVRRWCIVHIMYLNSAAPNSNTNRGGLLEASSGTQVFLFPLRFFRVEVCVFFAFFFFGTQRKRRPTSLRFVCVVDFSRNWYVSPRQLKLKPKRSRRCYYYHRGHSLSYPYHSSQSGH